MAIELDIGKLMKDAGITDPEVEKEARKLAGRTGPVMNAFLTSRLNFLECVAVLQSVLLYMHEINQQPTDMRMKVVYGQLVVDLAHAVYSVEGLNGVISQNMSEYLFHQTCVSGPLVGPVIGDKITLNENSRQGRIAKLLGGSPKAATIVGFVETSGKSADIIVRDDLGEELNVSMRSWYNGDYIILRQQCKSYCGKSYENDPSVPSLVANWPTGFNRVSKSEGCYIDRFNDDGVSTAPDARAFCSDACLKAGKPRCPAAQ